MGKKGFEHWDIVIFPAIFKFLQNLKFQKFDLKKFECMDIVYTWSQCLGW